MNKHELLAREDAPAEDYFNAYMSTQRYNELYEERRLYAAHKVAGWWSNRFEGLWNTYREDGYERENFYQLVDRSDYSISDSDGWLHNRARKIYLEAWAEQERRTQLEAWARSENLSIELTGRW
jgi:hypothetical protein